MTISDRLNKWMKENNLTTTEIKEKTGISTGALSEYRNNKKLIGSKTLISLEREFNLDINWLLTGKTQINLTQNEAEMLKYFKRLPEREQIKWIGKIEEAVPKYEVEGKSSKSIG